MLQQEILITNKYFQDKPVKNSYLFSSFAKNEADFLSDVDILDDLDYSEPLGLMFVELKLGLEILLKPKVDLVTTVVVQRHLLSSINAQKQVLKVR